jgi:hypothetical protein
MLILTLEIIAWTAVMAFATVADASPWVQRDRRWVCALHTESIAGDPFGRGKLAGK